MKLIHCADLHLDSRMSRNLDTAGAKERKGEILNTFKRMVDYAQENRVEAVLIAGDMFDTGSISAYTRNTVLHIIESHPDITFYYLKGNHDREYFLTGLEEIPANIRTFGNRWTYYRQGGVVIAGLELTAENAGDAYVSLVLENRCYNIVMLHGQEREGDARDKAEIVNIKALRNRGIDYLALGHIHAYKEERLDARGVYCYPGCLEGRGFDECGPHGFVLLDIDEASGACVRQFVPFASRTLYTVRADVTGCGSTAEMTERVSEALKAAGCGREDLVKIVLTGELDVACEKDVEHLAAVFRQSFYFVKVSDETTLKIAMEDYLLDVSLKGEFVRTVMADDALSGEEKKEIVRCGLLAIAGEEIVG